MSATIFCLALECVSVSLYVYTECEYVHILFIQYLLTSLCVCVCLLSVEASPSGLFNIHQLSFLLQEMDAADYYQKVHKFFMGKLKLWWLMNSVCWMAHAKLPAPSTLPSPAMLEIKRWRNCLCLFFSFHLLLVFLFLNLIFHLHTFYCNCFSW